MSHLERLFAALYVSEGWYVWWAERKMSDGLKNYARARAVVLFDRVIASDVGYENMISYLDFESNPHPTGIVNGPCVCGSWPGGECLHCPRI